MAWDFATEPEFQKELDWPRDYLPERVPEARARYADVLEREVGNL